MTALLLALDSLQARSPALFFWLDSFSKASLIILIALALHCFYRRQSASSHSLIWLVALLGCLFIPAFKLVSPEITVQIPVNTADAGSMIGSVFTNHFPESHAPYPDPRSILEILGWAYLLGVLLLIAPLLTGILSLIRLDREARTFPDHCANRILQRLLEENGTSANVTLSFSARTRTPYTWGIWRHRLVLPETALDWEPELLRQAIGHELGHILRNDWIIRIVGRFTLCLYWPNPLIWYATRSLKLSSEKACDDAAIDCSRSGVGYAANLLSLAGGKRPVPSRNTLALNLFSRPSELALRIRHILHPDKDRSFLRSDELFTIALLTLLLVVPFSTIDVSALVTSQSGSSRILIPVSFSLTDQAPPTAAVMESAMLPPRRFQQDSHSTGAVIHTGSRLSYIYPGAAPTTSFEVNDGLTPAPTVLFENWEATPLILTSPEYPLHALQRGIEGHVVAEFRVDENGNVFEPTIIESVPTGIFDKAVLRAVRQFVYSPEIVEGIDGNKQPIRKRFSFTLGSRL